MLQALRKKGEVSVYIGARKATCIYDVILYIYILRSAHLNGNVARPVKLLSSIYGKEVSF